MCKGIIISIVYFFLTFTNCYAETIKFLIEDSPYYIHQDMVIKKGQIFTADPGTVIEISKNVSIIIEGKIDITGYPKGGEVIFKASEPHQNYRKGFWNGIIIKSKEKNLINYAVIQHSKTGIEVTEDSRADISNNIITQNKTGVRAERVKELSITENRFLGNFIDIEISDSAGMIEKNYFQGSLTCIKLKESYPLIKRNAFKQAHKNIIHSDNEKKLLADENFWGVTDEELIKNRIYQSGRGKFIFKPFLKKPPNLRTGRYSNQGTQY